MPIKAVSNGKTFTFPDGTSQEDAAGAIDDYFTKNPAQTAQPSVTPEQKPEEPSYLSQVGQNLKSEIKGLGAGVAGVAGLPMDTALNIADLAKAGYGYTQSKITGKSPSEWTQPFDRSKIPLSSKSLTPEALKMTAEDNPYLYAGGAGVSGALLTRKIPGVNMTAGQAATYGQIAGMGSQGGRDIGQEIGGDTGANIGGAIGSFVAPMGVAGGASLSKSAYRKGADFVGDALKSSDQLSNTRAADVLSREIERSGATPKELAANAASRGDEGILADTNKTMRSLLGVAARENPKLAGESSNLLFARHKGQSSRIGETLDSVTGSGVTADEAISMMKKDTKPAITKLYAKAAEESKSFPIDENGNQLPPQISAMINGKSDIAKSAMDARQSIINKVEGGQESTPFDLINATKQGMDDRISALYRTGENNKARDLVILKNKFLSTADEAIPSFKEARDTFAGQAHLEEAAKNGELYNKMSLSEARDYTQGLSQSERAMALLGWKKDAVNRMANATTGADASSKIFGKNGDIEKVKLLLDNDSAANDFFNSMKREADFIATKRESEGSQSAEKLYASKNSQIGDTTLGTIRNIVSKGKEDRIKDQTAMKIGSILTKSGLTEDDLMAFLKSKTKEKEYTPLMIRAKTKAAQMGTISATQQANPQSKKQENK